MDDIQKLLWEAADLMIRRELGKRPGICGDELAEFAQKLGDEFVDMAERQFSDAMITGELVEEPPGGTTVPESAVN